MFDLTMSNNALMDHAEAVAVEALCRARGYLDRRHGAGWADAHPEEVAAFMTVFASHLHTVPLLRQLACVELSLGQLTKPVADLADRLETLADSL
ncbi:hypothetical protein [Crenobacter luteus]|nr:hypothetical protein [Crenobacter luteus]